MALVTVNGGAASPTNFNYYAFMHLAMYNAVAAITGEYELYRWDGVAPKVASPEAAAAAAAHRILTIYFPAATPRTSMHSSTPPWRTCRNPVARANGQAFGVAPPTTSSPSGWAMAEVRRDRSDEGDAARAVATDAARRSLAVHELRGWVASPRSP